MKKKILAVCLLGIILLSGCGRTAKNLLYDNDAAIAATDSYTASNYIGNRQDNQYTLSARMAGVRTLWRYHAGEAEDVEFSYSLNVTRGGKAKIVLISPDGTVTTLMESSKNAARQELHTETITLSPGENKIKIVGYNSPKFDLSLHAEVGDFGA